MDFINKIIAFFMSILGFISAVPGQSQYPVPENAEAYDITVMSYNIYISGTGKKSPENRAEGVLANINNTNPDVFGLQEADFDWINRLSVNLPDYSFVGRGRGKGETEDEFSPVFYKTDKFNLVDSGTFWFSKTPEKSSLTWGSAFRRICTWAVLEDKATGFTFGVFNSHWDHLSVVSRNNSAKLLAEKINEYAKDIPVVLTGDFNCKPNTVAFETLVNAGFVSSMYVAENTVTSGTYHGYTKGDAADELPIDHIMFRKTNGYAESYNVIKTKINDIYPSDHFPITSELILYK